MARQRCETEVAVKGCRGAILAIDHEGGDSEHGLGLHDLAAGVGEQHGAKTPALKGPIDSQATEQGDQDGVARQPARLSSRSDLYSLADPTLWS